MNKEILLKEIRGHGSLIAYWKNHNILVLDMDIRYFYYYEEELIQIMNENGWDEFILAENVVVMSIRNLLLCYDEKDIDTWSWVKPRLRLCCARKDYDQYALQKSVVHKDILDVKLFARVFTNNKYMVEIPEDSLEKWKKSKKIVFETARKNSLKEIEFGQIEQNDDDIPLYHMTTNKRNFGASVIAYNEKMAQISRLLGSDLVIMPFSRDEVFITPKCIIETSKDGVTKYTDIGILIKELLEVSNRSVSEAEFISEHVYVYLQSKNKVDIYI